MKTYKCDIIYRVAASYEVEADNPADAENLAYELWEQEERPYTQYTHHEYIDLSGEIDTDGTQLIDENIEFEKN